MNIVKITHNIPEETIKLEEKRDVPKMTEEDLNWCFGAEITFKDLSTEDILMELEVALFGFLNDFLGVVVEFADLNVVRSRIINDPYGAFSLEINLDGKIFKAVDNFSGQSFQCEMIELKSACANLLKECIEDVENKFPAILENPNYLISRKKLLELGFVNNSFSICLYPHHT